MVLCLITVIIIGCVCKWGRTCQDLVVCGRIGFAVLCNDPWIERFLDLKTLKIASQLLRQRCATVLVNAIEAASSSCYFLRNVILIQTCTNSQSNSLFSNACGATAYLPVCSSVYRAAFCFSPQWAFVFFPHYFSLLCCSLSSSLVFTGSLWFILSSRL